MDRVFSPLGSYRDTTGLSLMTSDCQTVRCTSVHCEQTRERRCASGPSTRVDGAAVAVLIGRPVPSSVRHSRGAADNRKAQALAVGKPWSGQLVPSFLHAAVFRPAPWGNCRRRRASRPRTAMSVVSTEGYLLRSTAVSVSRLAVYGTV